MTNEAGTGSAQGDRPAAHDDPDRLDDPGWTRHHEKREVTTSPLGDRLPPWYPRALIYTALTVASLVLLRVTIYLLRDLLLMLMVALFLSFAMEPAVNWLADRGWRRGAANQGRHFAGTAVRHGECPVGKGLR